MCLLEYFFAYQTMEWREEDIVEAFNIKQAQNRYKLLVCSAKILMILIICNVITQSEEKSKIILKWDSQQKQKISLQVYTGFKICRNHFLAIDATINKQCQVTIPVLQRKNFRAKNTVAV